MKIIRTPMEERVLGESLATLKDGDENVELPVSASNFQEVKHASELSRTYRFGIAYQNEFFTMNPFFIKTRFGTGTKFLDEQTGIANNWIGQSQASKSIYAPKFSTSINQPSKEIDMTVRVSMHSVASYVSVREGVSLNGTRRLIQKYRAIAKTEKTEKELLLILGMGQDEDDYRLKYALARQQGIKAVMSEWGNPLLRWQNYIETAKLHSSDILRIISNVPKPYQRKYAFGTTAILFGDVIANAPIIGGGEDPPKGQKRLVLTEAQKKRIAITNASRFNIPDNTLYTQAGCKKDNIVKLNCPCEPCDFAGDTTEDFFREFNNDLYGACGVHNTKATHEAIVRLRSFIGKGLLKELNNRKGARKILEEIYKISPNQQRIVV